MMMGYLLTVFIATLCFLLPGSSAVHANQHQPNEYKESTQSTSSTSTSRQIKRIKSPKDKKQSKKATSKQSKKTFLSLNHHNSSDTCRLYCQHVVQQPQGKQLRECTKDCQASSVTIPEFTGQPVAYISDIQNDGFNIEAFYIVKVNQWDFVIDRATIEHNGNVLPASSYKVRKDVNAILVYESMVNGLNDFNIAVTSTAGQVATLAYDQRHVCAGHIVLKVKLVNGTTGLPFDKKSRVNVALKKNALECQENSKWFEETDFLFYNVPYGLVVIQATEQHYTSEGQLTLWLTGQEAAVTIEMHPY